MPRASIFTTRSWDPDAGDPAAPEEVLGIEVTRLLCESRDPPGALVALADRRYALTGPLLAVGSPRQLARNLRRRARHRRAAERAWMRRAADASPVAPSSRAIRPR